MIYEIINPSDYHTMVAEDREIACYACLMLGGGKYGLAPIPEGEGKGCPLMIFWDEKALDDFWQSEFGRTFDDAGEEFMHGKKAELIAAFESVLIGKRSEYERLISFVEPEKQAEFRTSWDDARRSSMNDISGRARQYAAHIREKAA